MTEPGIILIGPERRSWNAAGNIEQHGKQHMADIKQPHEPGPRSGYREKQDPRGQPGEHKTTDGREVPEDEIEDSPDLEPGEH